MCFLSKGIVQKKKGQKFRTILYVILSLITAYAMIYIDMNSTPLSRTRLGMYITGIYPDCGDFGGNLVRVWTFTYMCCWRVYPLYAFWAISAIGNFSSSIVL